MPYIIYQQSKVAFQQIGQGHPLVLLHGFCEDSTMWAEFIPLLSKKYRILTIDLSGFGKSDLLPNGTITEMSEAVVAVLAELAIPKCTIIGHSMGGYVALEFAKKYPNQLQGLGLFHSHPFLDSPERIINRKKTISFIQRHGVAPFASQFVRNLFAKPFVKNNPMLIEELVHHTSAHHTDAVIAASYAMINRLDHTQTLQQLTCPVLFIIGQQDAAVPYSFSLAQTSLPACSSVHILPQIGHLGTLEAPHQTATIINQFLDFCTLISL
jgi:pimeloyl-ACP methyl ester carboxylesterase